MYITVLCKVVDNYGDIGVAWRMCRRLSKIQNKYKICLVVDDLVSFAKINSNVNTGASFQIVDDVEVFLWSDNELCSREFSENDGERLGIILECFQCGRPDWMEHILFEKKLNRVVQIIMIDYLTAEKYAEDFHCLKSLTRSARVQKVNFMPGFTEKTGGLIIDEEWKDLPVYNENGPVLVFTYDSGFNELMNAFERIKQQGFAQKILLTQSRPIPTELSDICESLPYMPQTEWDKMMKQCSALVIRGEESLSRACLSGIPFIWQAYPQSEEYQLVKVKALLERMKSHFDEGAFEIVEKTWLCINGEGPFDKLRDPDDLGCLSKDLRCLSLSKAPYDSFFSNLKILLSGFQSFAQSLRKNGDLCTNLMTFINNIDIIV